jgi:hypothetical protein
VVHSTLTKEQRQTIPAAGEAHATWSHLVTPGKCQGRGAAPASTHQPVGCSPHQPVGCSPHVLPQPSTNRQTVQQSCQCAVQCTLATPTQPDMCVCWNNAQYTRTRTLATLVHQEWIHSQLLPTTGAGRPPASPYDTPLTHLYPPARVRSATAAGGCRLHCCSTTCRLAAGRAAAGARFPPQQQVCVLNQSLNGTFFEEQPPCNHLQLPVRAMAVRTHTKHTDLLLLRSIMGLGCLPDQCNKQTCFCTFFLFLYCALRYNE